MADIKQVFRELDDELKFPLDLNGDFYPEAIRFGIYKRQGPSYKGLKAETVALFNKGKDGLKAAGASLSQQNNTRDAIKANKNRVLDDTFTEEAQKANAEKLKSQLAQQQTANGERSKASIKGLGTDASGFINRTFVEAVKPKLERSVEHLIQNIYLNMPASVAFNEAVGWQGTDMGIVGAMKAAGGNDNMKASDVIENGLLGNAGALLGGAVASMGSLVGGGMAAPIVGAIVGGGGLQAGIESTFNVQANPYKEQTFNGVDFRTFDFAFTFRALSQEDVNIIQKIITSFRACSKPTYDGNNGETGVFAYPKEFYIEFLTLDENDVYQTNKFLPELKYCVCTGVNTNFTGTGWRSFVGGAPVDITMQLTFSETEIITGEDVLGATAHGRYNGKGRKF